MNHRVLPWASWPGTVALGALAEGTRLAGFAVSHDARRLAWSELTPAQNARAWLCVASVDDPAATWTLPDFSPRITLHEYGGLAVWAGTAALPWLFVEESDQGLWGVDGDGVARPVWVADGLRYGDCNVHAASGRVVCLEEDPVGERTRVVLLELASGRRRVLAERDAFCAAPRFSPDGRQVAWIAWNPPDMPWTRTQLWVMTLATGEARALSNGASAVIEPRWAADGSLMCLDDRAGWWQVYRATGDGLVRVNDHAVDLGRPPWQLGFGHHVCGPDGSTFAVTIDRARCGLVRIGADGSMTALPTPDVDITGLHWDGRWLWYLGAPEDGSRAVRRLDPATGETERLATETPEPEPAKVSRPRAVSAPGPQGVVHGFLFRPFAPGVTGPADTAPPLLVRAHGGPTAMRSPAWNPEVQFWTGRGVAVLEVNYGGSSGHGRDYRDRLRGRWGLTDRDDCVALARAMIDTGEADARHCFIAGNSAGGLTVLNALRGESIFAGGLCRWGVTELARLAALTHRFERPYLDYLVGALDAQRERYEARSPALHAHEITAAVLLIQGENDRVVPPSQAREMVAAMETAGGHAELAVYPGEGHGLRQAAHIRDAIERELAFLQRQLSR